MSLFSVPSESIESPFNMEPEAIIWFQRYLESLRRGDFISRNACIEKYEDGRLSFESSLVDIIREPLYALPEFPIFLLPGYVNFHYGYRRLCAIAKEQVKLDGYEDRIFVYRNKRRSQLLEVRLWPEDSPFLIRYGSQRDKEFRFLDNEWPGDESSVKIVPMENYKAMLDRMLSCKKAL